MSNKTDVRTKQVRGQKIPPGGVGGCSLVLVVVFLALAAVGFAQRVRTDGPRPQRVGVELTR